MQPGFVELVDTEWFWGGVRGLNPISVYRGDSNTIRTLVPIP